MSYKLKRMKKIAKTYGNILDRVNELYEILIKKHGKNANWSETESPEDTEFMKLINETIENLRDDFVVSEKVAIRYFFDALRLRGRGKI
ncbi:MAG: hypothetical protein NWF06_03765 [Candidatus Bathyarchaeota archaeon]|nr:hypothetical protein [Candidatus Bathyarchaeum sp.]